MSPALSAMGMFAFAKISLTLSGRRFTLFRSMLPFRIDIESWFLSNPNKYS